MALVKGKPMNDSRPTRSAAAAYGRLVGFQHGQKWAAEHASAAELACLRENGPAADELLFSLIAGWHAAGLLDDLAAPGEDEELFLSGYAQGFLRARPRKGQTRGSEQETRRLAGPFSCAGSHPWPAALAIAAAQFASCSGYHSLAKFSAAVKCKGAVPVGRQSGFHSRSPSPSITALIERTTTAPPLAVAEAVIRNDAMGPPRIARPPGAKLRQQQEKVSPSCCGSSTWKTSAGNNSASFARRAKSCSAGCARLRPLAWLLCLRRLDHRRASAEPSVLIEPWGPFSRLGLFSGRPAKFSPIHSPRIAPTVSHAS